MNESQKNNTVEEKNNQNKPVNKKNDTGARILCLVGAMLIWFYAVSSQTIIEDTRFASIPVKLMSVDTLEEEYGMTVISGTVSVFVTVGKTTLHLLDWNAETGANVNAQGPTARIILPDESADALVLTLKAENGLSSVYTLKYSPKKAPKPTPQILNL